MGQAVTPPFSGSSSRLLPLVLLLGYALIPVVTPSLHALDSNGPKFLVLSLFNLLGLGYLLFRPGDSSAARFFIHPAGIAWTLFMSAVCLSFTQALNLPEAILNFSKYFTVFCAAFIIAMLLTGDRRYLRTLSVVFAGILIADSLVVFYETVLYIRHVLPSIIEIKSVYSNKNILASAIFVKIPFALWLFTVEKGWMKKLGFAALAAGVLATLFLSSRAFYLGLAFLAVAYPAYLFIWSRRQPGAKLWQPVLLFLGMVVAAGLLFSFVQYFFYPAQKVEDVYNASVASRFSSMSSKESSASQRLENWQRSFALLKSSPVLGVGTGNWKIRVMQYENPEKPDFTLSLKNHNDFIEIAAETGLIGGLLFVSLFVIVFILFLRALLHTGSKGPGAADLFIPGFGMLCYSFDAFFNFPSDRPEIQVLFAIFIGAAIADSLRDQAAGAGKGCNIAVLSGWILLLLPVAWVLLLNFNSLRIQNDVHQESLQEAPTSKTGELVEAYPFIPTVSTLCEPIAVHKAQYRIMAGKYQSAIDILKDDRSSPYDGRREIFLTLAWFKAGNTDSALRYAYQAYALKPRYFNSLDYICQVLELRGEKEQPIKMLQEFVGLEKKSAGAWLRLATLQWSAGKYQQSLCTLDSAVAHLPDDTLVKQKREKLKTDLLIVPVMDSYTRAMEFLGAGNYKEAMTWLNKILERERGIAIVYAGRAYCNYNGRAYQACIDDIGHSISLGHATPDLFNLRGLCRQALGDLAGACSDFGQAAQMGDKDAVSNQARFCGAR